MKSHAAMALVNPIYAFVVPFLFVVTLPLALFAGITTTLAFSLLIFRVLVVYLDVAISLVPQSLAGLRSARPRRHLALSSSAASLSAVNHHHHHGSSNANSVSNSPPPTPMLARKRRRRPSSASIMSNGSATPVSETGLGLMPSVGPERDYEGVGGWRTGDDDVWTTINSRLELPDRNYVRNHHRTPSGPTTPGDSGFLVMKSRTRSPDTRSSKAGAPSPNSSRARTPPGPRISFGYSDSYFPTMTSPKVGKKPPSSVHGA